MSSHTVLYMVSRAFQGELVVPTARANSKHMCYFENISPWWVSGPCLVFQVRQIFIVCQANGASFSVQHTRDLISMASILRLTFRTIYLSIVVYVI